MNLKHALLLITLLCSLTLSAQNDDLFMALEYRMAYENGTRNWDGTVSEKYFQNHSSYDIQAIVNPATRQLNANAKITYFNKSPKTLRSIVIHRYKDLYKEGMIVNELSVQGSAIDLNDQKQVKKSGTNYTIVLPEALTPGDYVEMEIDWSITIPEKVNRDGAYDESSMFVAYWYPEVAVYDDVFGWDDIVFDGKAEFYHDVSNFKVSLEIPENFVVWASDAPVNGQEIYPRRIRKKLEEAQSSTEKVEIISKDDLKKGLKMKNNVWKYEVEDFPDFSFAFSDHYLWEAAAYEDEHGKYFVNSAYPVKNEAFKHVVDNEKDALDIFHHQFPKYPFPFRHFVAFNGETGGGMEFAGMCNDQERRNYSTEGNKLSDYDANKLLTVHEMMHMYFPFLMGINEKRYAWLDEGMAEFAEDAFTDVNLESYRSRARFARAKNPPLMVETYTIPKSYGTISYDISSQAFYALMKLLGKDTFDNALYQFMNRWKNKHPTPYDFFFTFNEVTDQDLNWFWNDWFFDWGYPDVGIKSFENGELTIQNIGGRPIAIHVEITSEDGKKESLAISPAVWKSAKEYKLPIDNASMVKSLELKTLNGPDAIADNNIWIK